MYIQEPGSGSLTSYACSRCWRFSGIAVLMLLVGLVALGNEGRWRRWVSSQTCTGSTFTPNTYSNIALFKVVKEIREREKKPQIPNRRPNPKQGNPNPNKTRERNASAVGKEKPSKDKRRERKTQRLFPHAQK